MFYLFSATGGISIGYKRKEIFLNEAMLRKPKVIIVIDNFNRVVRKTSWGSDEHIDVVHGFVKVQEIHAPAHLSKTSPKIPLADLTG